MKPSELATLKMKFELVIDFKKVIDLAMRQVINMDTLYREMDSLTRENSFG